MKFNGISQQVLGQSLVDFQMPDLNMIGRMTCEEQES